jgi:NRAMP (natural resistance-associated macrophage protein)-like metal ion transporter
MPAPRKHNNALRRLWKKLGPGLVTGASDDDPSGIVTYTQAGAAYGTNTLWTAWITIPLMIAIQKMCARIGIVTSKGLIAVIKEHYPAWVLYTMALFSFPAIIMNVGADIAGVGAVCQLMFPRIEASYFSIVFTVVLLVAMIYLPYNKIAAVLKYLCITLFVYFIVPFLVKQNWMEVLRSCFVPQLKFNKDSVNILVAILGTTISPYLFFWQATMEAENKVQKKVFVIDKRIMREMDLDTDLGMIFSNMVMFFIILTAGTVLFNGGIHNINTVEQAAEALKPLAGNAAYILFAVGIIATGVLSIPVLSGCLAYIVAEAFGWKEGLDKKFNDARSFYIVMAVSFILGLSLNYIGISPVKALIYSSVLYGVTAPVLIAIIMHICNNKKIMGGETNGILANILGFATLLLMTVAAVLLVWFQFK